MLKDSSISNGDDSIFSSRGCNDLVVGAILSGWRYDISGVSPEMRGDYEQHLAECDHCHGRQRMHRSIDLGLMGLSTVSIAVFLLATEIIHREHFSRVMLAAYHVHNLSFALTAQVVAIAGLLFSMLMWVLVAIATPAPGLISEQVAGTVRHVRGRGL